MNSYLSRGKAVVSAVVASGALLASSVVLAQDPVSFDVDSVQALPGQSVTFSWHYVGNDDARSIDARINFSDPSLIENIDFSDCTTEMDQVVDLSTCTDQGGTGDNVFFSFQNQGGPIPTASGNITVDISAAASEGDVILLEYDPAAFVIENDPDVNSEDGQIEVIGVPPEELSELAVTPASLAFGTVDLGNMPVTDTITAENVGGSASSLTINSAAFTGDAEFSIITNGCDGTSLAQNETCDVVVEFNAGANGTFSGGVAFDSDADTNPTADVEVSGSADSVADLSVDPAFGAVNLGQGLPGSTISADGSVSNDGSADGEFSCALTGDPEITTDPDLSSPITVAAGDSVGFSISCALPQDGVEGDSFNATLECSGDNGFGGTHDISCGITERQPLAVPTMSKIGLGVLALLMVMIGGLTVRFFRT
ncbi:choice-of-anchor D domain-containing protein [Wenzhouxiangella sp. EGI_FJ10409]|uniref:choice-of-anchor D domain-containing protein n=1 Tax=Wenzhouxiangella sp. EGI_FJ10409 TaxID=3243767 RepID=UPI0035DDEEC4